MNNKSFSFRSFSGSLSLCLYLSPTLPVPPSIYTQILQLKNLNFIKTLHNTRIGFIPNLLAKVMFCFIYFRIRYILMSSSSCCAYMNGLLLSWKKKCLFGNLSPTQQLSHGASSLLIYMLKIEMNKRDTRSSLFCFFFLFYCIKL